MPETSFILINIEFEHEKTITAKLFGRNQHNEQICLLDEKVYDYFLIDLTGKDEVAIKTFFENKGSRVEVFDAEIHDTFAKVAKIFTTSLDNTKDLVELAKSTFSVDCYEHDIDFQRKYVLEKQLFFGELYVAKFEEASFKEFVPINGRLDSIEKLPSNTMNINPKVMYFDIETFDDGKGINYDSNQILMITIVLNGSIYNLVAKKYDSTLKNIEVFDDEVQLLSRFVEIVKTQRPDVLAGYNIKGFDIPYIIHRCKKFDVELDIGTDNSTFTEFRTKQKYALHGIQIFDQFQIMRGLFRFSITDGGLSLNNVSQKLLGSEKIDVNIRELSLKWKDKNVDISAIDLFVSYCEKDTLLCQDLFSYFVKDLLEFQSMLNTDYEELSVVSFSQIVENFLIHNARAFNQIIPVRPDEEAVRLRQDKRIEGAFVYDPKPGFYRDISVFDFTSLYPTVIGAHNITKGTISQDSGDNYEQVPERDFFIRKSPKAFIPTIIEDIVERRIRLKAMIKSAKKEDIAHLQSRLQTLKIVANSLYGYLAFYMARWYSFEAAESVTAFARYHTKDVISIFEQKGFDVIYSDTDSVFVLENPGIKETTDEIVEEINVSLPGIMSLEKEDTFSKGMFVGMRGSEKGAKKKYALLSTTGKYKIAGMAMVRGDWSAIARSMQEDVIHILLETEDVEKAIAYVKNEVSSLASKDISDFLISTKLKKPVSEYASKGPHVVVAEKMIAKGMFVRTGQDVSYVITKIAGRKATIGERAKLVEDVASTSELDFEYYKQNQIYPVLIGLFDLFGVDIENEVERKEEGLSKFF